MFIFDTIVKNTYVWIMCEILTSSKIITDRNLYILYPSFNTKRTDYKYWPIFDYYFQNIKAKSFFRI